MFKDLNSAKSVLLDALKQDFGVIEIKNINDWYLLSWNQFYSELNKQGINLLGCKTRDWKVYFLAEKVKMDILLREICRIKNAY